MYREKERGPEGVTKKLILKQNEITPLPPQSPDLPPPHTHTATLRADIAVSKLLLTIIDFPEKKGLCLIIN